MWYFIDVPRTIQFSVLQSNAACGVFSAEYYDQDGCLLTWVINLGHLGSLP